MRLAADSSLWGKDREQFFALTAFAPESLWEGDLSEAPCSQISPPALLGHRDVLWDGSPSLTSALQGSCLVQATHTAVFVLSSWRMPFWKRK